MTDEAVVAAQPDIIVITERSFERSGGVDGVVKFPGVALTPAGKNKRIVPVSDMYFQGFGPGVGKAVRELTLKFHPELAGQNKCGSSDRFFEAFRKHRILIVKMKIEFFECIIEREHHGANFPRLANEAESQGRTSRGFWF